MRRSTFSLTTVAVLVGQALAGGALHAATFTVTNTDDSGGGSLRQAVVDANAAVGADNIVFDPGLQGSTITLTSGEISITEDLTITGPGTGITISGGSTSRIFNGPTYCYSSYGPPPTASLILANLTLTSGQSGDYAGGGAVRTCGDVSVTDSVVTGSTASYGALGGGIRAESGSVTLSGTTVSNNQGGGGGGVAADGPVTLTNSSVTGNTATSSRGGGVSADGSVTLTNSSVTGNTALSDSGGGVASFGDVTVAGSTVVNNTASYFGGGIDAADAVSVTNSTVAGNRVYAGEGGGSGGGIYAAQVTVSSSTISGNQADESGGALGGYSVSLTNSTVSGNTAVDRGGGIDASTVVIDNSTISSNAVTDPGGIGGGVSAYDATLSNTLVAGNTAPSGPDIFGTLNNSSYNLVGDGTDATGIVDGVNGNLVGSAAAPVDPLLGPLANNGGPTLTHALLAGSPALDAGDPAFTPPPDFDQRGSPFDRVAGGRIDIGAFEAQPTGSIEFATASAAFNEEAGTVSVSVLRTDASIGELTVTVTSSSGTAIQGTDFQAVNQSLVFPAGVAQQTVGVTLLDDADCEGDETFQLSLAGDSIGATAAMTVRIVDDADLSGTACRDTIAFSQPDYAAGETAGDAVLVVRRQGAALEAAEVSFATLDGAATSPEDFTASQGSLSWPAGDTTDREVRVPVVDDIFIEGDEQFQVTLSNAVGAQLDSALSTASVTILDNEIPDTDQTLQLSLGGDRVINEGESLTGDIERVGGSSGAVSVNVGTFNGDAMAGEDYQAQVTVLRWADGELGTKSFTVTTIDDTEPEGDESFVVSLTNPVNAALNTEAQQITVTLRDNDVAPLGGVVRMVTSSTKAFVTEDGTEVAVRRVGGNEGAADALILVAPRASDRITAQVAVSWEAGESGVRTAMLPREAFDASFGDHFTITLEGDGVAVSDTSAAMDLTVVGRATVSGGTSADGGGGGGAIGPWSLLLMALLTPLVGRLRRRRVQP